MTHIPMNTVEERDAVERLKVLLSRIYMSREELCAIQLSEVIRAEGGNRTASSIRLEVSIRTVRKEIADQVTSRIDFERPQAKKPPSKDPEPVESGSGHSSGSLRVPRD